MTKQIGAPVAALLHQLQELLEMLTDEQYGKAIALLSNASIGQHTRHIIEFFIELGKGYETGIVNYDARQRDYTLETERDFAISTISGIMASIQKENRPLTLIADFGENDTAPCSVPTNYQRELMYNLEHIIHHMAILRIGVNAVSAIRLPDDFGVAFSTIKYRKACAQ